MNLTFTTELIPAVLPIIGWSMLGIFAVVGVIVLAVSALTAVVRKIEEKKDQE